MSLRSPNLGSRLLAAALLSVFVTVGAWAAEPERGLLFYVSGDRGTTADRAASGRPVPTFDREVTSIEDGAIGTGLSCADMQVLAWRAPGSIYAQRGTLAFFWRSRYPVGPTAFPLFRVAYADHSSWDMTWLRIDYNGAGFDAFVTDVNLGRTRVSATVRPFPVPGTWTHVAFAWDEATGVRLYVNGVLAASKDAVAVYTAALDQMGPHSRIISPYQVQSDYNFVRGGDIDEIRIYDRMLDGEAVAALAAGKARLALAPLAARRLDEPKTAAEWTLRYGFGSHAVPLLPEGNVVVVRKVEIHEAYDLKRWWWKATDGIRETTWPGVFNRSRLPGRHDYFELPDWDCYVDSGRSITFALLDEAWNHVEVAGGAGGAFEVLPVGTELANAYLSPLGSPLFDRPRGVERTVHDVAPHVGGLLRFVNQYQEEPIGELTVYHVAATAAVPEGSRQLIYVVESASTTAAAVTENASLAALGEFVAGRFPADERALLVARLVGEGRAMGEAAPVEVSGDGGLPLVHVLVPDGWDEFSDGLDGVALELPVFGGSEPLALNVRVKDPLWPLREIADFSFSVLPGQARTLWLDLRDRLLPTGRGLWLSMAGADDRVSAAALAGLKLKLIFKPREEARAEHELDRFTQAKDAYAMLVEEHPNRPMLDLWNRFKGDLEDLLRINPEHPLGVQYAYASNIWTRNRERANEVAVLPAKWDERPEWAVRQVELLARVKKFVNWYIDHRQSAYGDFGGGVSDDVDLTNTWPGVALMGSDPEKIGASLRALLDAAYRNGMFSHGLPAIQTDELHSYEEGINCLAQNLLLDPSSPRQLERAMETARGVAGITGVNAAGHRHIMSSYYSGTKMAREAPWGRSKPYSYLVCHVPQLLVEFNGNPTARQTMLELTDALAAHFGHDGLDSVRASIDFASDEEFEATRGLLPWHMFWGSYKWTGNAGYLDPLKAGGLSMLAAINANAMDLLNSRDDWQKRLVEGDNVGPVEVRRRDGRTRSSSTAFRASVQAHFEWQLDGDKSRLSALYAGQAALIDSLEYINTEGSLWIDRVAVPTAELQRARLGGIALVRNALYPGHVVSWRFGESGDDERVAILMPDATPTAFTVILCNLSDQAIRASMTGCDVEPGTWKFSQGLDANDDDAADVSGGEVMVTFERLVAHDLVLPARATVVLRGERVSAGTPYWDRPDAGLEAGDVQRIDGGLNIRVHSLGSVGLPACKLAVFDEAGVELSSVTIPAMEAPTDLWPRTVDVFVPVPADGVAAAVEYDPERRLDEITRRNNRADLRR